MSLQILAVSWEVKDLITRDELNKSLFVGIDTHKYDHTAFFANRFEEKLGVCQFENTSSGVSSFLEKVEALKLQTGLTPIFGIEGSGGNGFLLAKRLLSEYTRVYEVNAIFTQTRRQHSTRQDKSDEKDASLVVSVLTRNVNQLPRLSLEHTHQQAYLITHRLVKTHEDLVKEQTRLKNQLHYLLHKEDAEYKERFKTVFSKTALNYWRQRCYRKTKDELTNTRRKIIVWKINRFFEVEKQILEVDKSLEPLVRENGEYLLSLPGVGICNAAKLLAYVKSASRFKNADSFTRFIGCVPEKRSSGKKKGHKRAKMSKRSLYTTIYSIMLTQLRCCPKAKDYYKKKLSEGKTKKQAQRALMKIIGRIVYGMMSKKGEYRG